MRILYVSAETPILPVGGIGTYLGYAAKAMADAGNEIYLLTWTFNQQEKISNFAPFTAETAKILSLDRDHVWRAFPTMPFNHALATYIEKEIAHCVDVWDIEVVEATDYLSPALSYFQAVQSTSRARDILCVTYNHGFIEDFYDADQISPTRGSQDNMVGERQQCRSSDLTIVPSVAALRRLAQFDIVDNLTVVREPYVFADMRRDFETVPTINYLGRISISKGIDKLVYFANLLDEVLPLEAIVLIGKCINTPFRGEDIHQYVTHRLKPHLRGLITFTGSVERQTALDLLRSGTFSPHLGSAETFSYACIEAIDRGLLPVVRQGTPMAEFFPAEWRDCIFDETFRSQVEMRKTIERLIGDGERLVAAIQDFNQQELAPKKIAEQMSVQYEAGLRAKKGLRSILVRQPATIEDVTIAISAFRPTEDFTQTIDSIAGQRVGAPSVIICDDGTPMTETIWFDYARMRLPKLHIVRQTNSGLLSARNTLISHVETPLTVFLDADDILAATYLKRVLEAYNDGENYPNAVLTHRRNFSESDEKIIQDRMADHTHMIRNEFRMTALIETAILRKIGFDSTRRNGEAGDWNFWLQFGAEGYRAIMVPEFLFHHRTNAGSASWPGSNEQDAGTRSMIRQTLIELGFRRPNQARLVARALYAVMTVSE